MADKSAESTVGKYLGAPITGALTALVTWATAGWTGAIGSALVALLAILGGIFGLALTLYYRRQLAVLGANRRIAAERQAYDALRNSLAQGNMAARLYAQRLTTFLDAIDRFFGDAGMADRTLFPHAFGLKTPAPLWTAAAMDRCLVLALIYPVAAIFIIWAASGHVGPAETALHLKSDLPGWQRGLAAGAVGFLFLPWWRYVPNMLWAFFGGVVASALALSLLYAGLLAGAVYVGAAVILNTVVISIRKPIGGAAVVTVVFVPLFATALAVVIDTGATAAIVLAIVALAVGLVGPIAVVWISDIASKHRREGIFLLLLFPTLIAACLIAANLWAPLRLWELSGPIVLFFGLLPLLNAPFDWASLGLTRALLRRGLELGGWWPYALALADAALAAVIIAALAIVMVVGVQFFDGMAEHGGGAPVLPLDALFNGIVAHPSAPEYWWLYALLLSTMIPSLVNLVIGGASLVRGVPGLPALLLRFMPERGGVLKWDRTWIAGVLTAQVAIGAALGIAAQAFLALGIIGYVMPWLGLGLLDMARDVAAFNLPERVGQLFGVSL
jgi:hypothetical protein